MHFEIIVPWHNKLQLDAFLSAWDVSQVPRFLRLQQDAQKDGCALTKNKGIAAAIENKAKVIIVLDDDCFPQEEAESLEELAEQHIKCLEPQDVEMFEQVAKPASRGTPYFCRSIKMPVAASMGFWTNVGDYDAPGQLVHGATKPMEFARKSIHGKYFPLCGMNLAFSATWWPWCQFINVPRFDDIWQGFLWQKIAYAKGYCFNLNGPLVTHSRQSNVWANLREETVNLEKNETLWREVALQKTLDYGELSKLCV